MGFHKTSTMMLPTVNMFIVGYIMQNRGGSVATARKINASEKYESALIHNFSALITEYIAIILFKKN